MPNTYFQFKKFIVQQDHCAMKVTTDGCLFGAWVGKVGSRESGDGSQSVLDIGTGTGLLSLMIAQKINAPIDTIEIDKDAFEQARDNIAASPWANQINLFYGDVREFDFGAQYEMIISNPPFYENELKSPDTKKNTAHHEGLALNELLGVIKKNLGPGGTFYLLLPYKRSAEIDKLIFSNDLAIEQKTLVRQSPGKNYFRVMLSGGHKSGTEKINQDEICIRNEQQQYTKEFTALLKDYYLYLDPELPTPGF
jgi:tRNA1Val (adenine37-N6)-methyltransferase